MIVFFAFISDFDVFLAKYTKYENHRMLVTHSIYPSIIIIIIGYIIDWPALYLSGYSYSIHVLLDTLDWGTNFFYFQKKQVGLKLLISKEEFENITEYLSNYKNPASFFDQKYYKNKICVLFEVIIFILMILFIILLAFPYIFLIILYFPFVLFHLYRHFNLKKIESQ